MSRTFTIPVRVYIEDTDAGGIVYYANYLRYMERARTDWLREAGVDLVAWQYERKRMFVVHSVALRYRLPARYNDLLAVTATLVRDRRVSLELEQQVRRGDELLVSGSVELACVDPGTLKPAAIPSTILEAIASGD